MYFINTVKAEDLSHEVVEGTDSSFLSSFGINGPLFFFQLINFTIVFLIVWFLILKPLSKKLTERQQIIDKTIADSKKAEKMVKQNEEEYQKCLLEAKKKSKDILDEAQNASEKIAESMKENAQKEIKELIERAKKLIKEEKEQTIKELRGETVSLLVLALEKIIEEKIDKNKYLEDIIQKIK